MPKAPKPKNPPSEKATEMLFTAYLLQTVGLQKVTILAPSTSEEADLAYDALYTGHNSCWELLIQFKKPSSLRKNEEFTMKIYDGKSSQHTKLHDLAKKGHEAYYACATYRSIPELESLQKNISDPCQFLDNHIAIKATDIHIDANCVRYGRRHISHTNGWRSTSPRETVLDCRGEANYTPINQDRFCDLIKAFMRREIGYRVIYKNASRNAPEDAMLDDREMSDQSDKITQPLRANELEELSEVASHKDAVLLRTGCLPMEQEGN